MLKDEDIGKSDSALTQCWLLLLFKGFLFDASFLSGYVCTLSRVCLAIAPVPILFLRVWERASGCGDAQAGFLPKSCLDGETHKVQRDFLFCFPQAQVTIDYKTHTCGCAHTHTHMQKQKHTQTKQDVLSPPLARVQGTLVTICVTFTHGLGFHHYGN